MLVFFLVSLSKSKSKRGVFGIGVLVGGVLIMLVPEPLPEPGGELGEDGINGLDGLPVIDELLEELERDGLP